MCITILDIKIRNAIILNLESQEHSSIFNTERYVQVDKYELHSIKYTSFDSTNYLLQHNLLITCPTIWLTVNQNEMKWNETKWNEMISYSASLQMTTQRLFSTNVRLTLG